MGGGELGQRWACVQLGRWGAWAKAGLDLGPGGGEMGTVWSVASGVLLLE
jgi:hypothetical protein